MRYSLYLFGNLHAYQKDAGFGWGWNYGLGNRIFLTDSLALELLVNLNDREHERRISTKFLYFD